MSRPLSEAARANMRDLGRRAGAAYVEQGTIPRPVHDLWSGHPWSRQAATAWHAGFREAAGEPVPLPA